jgi:hypothetical protein
MDLSSRTPGRFVRWDSTFEFTSKTAEDPESVKALAVIFGEYTHILSFAFRGLKAQSSTSGFINIYTSTTGSGRVLCCTTRRIWG